MEKRGLKPAPKKEAPPAEKPAPAQQGMPPEQAQQAQQQATPEEQEQSDHFIGRALELMSDDKVATALVERLQHRSGQGEESEMAVEALASASLMVFDRVMKAATDASAQLSPSAMANAGAEIVANVALLAETANIYEYSEEEINAAYVRAASIYGERMNAEGGAVKDAASQDWNSMVQADQQGNVDSVAPGLSQVAAQMQQGGKKAPPQEA